MTLAPFHLAFPVNGLAEARVFYGGLLGCTEGRSDGDWIDFNFFGHQIVAYRAPQETGMSGTSGVLALKLTLAFSRSKCAATSLRTFSP